MLPNGKTLRNSDRILQSLGLSEFMSSSPLHSIGARGKHQDVCTLNKIAEFPACVESIQQE